MKTALVACECSGAIRDELISEGIDAVSCDLKDTEKPGPHYKGDVLDILYYDWDLLIAHPVCRYLANSGVRWLHERPGRWEKMEAGARFFSIFVRATHIKYRAIENPKMHGYGMDIIGGRPTQYVQPWWFGDPYQKETAWWLYGLPKLVATHKKSDYPEIKQECWLESPGPDREANRSRTYPCHAKAIAKQWGEYIRTGKQALPTQLKLH